MRTRSIGILVLALAAAGCSPPGGGDATVMAESNATGSWSCAKSQYHGQQYWTCAGGTLNKCDASGHVEQVSCGSAGCKSNPTGVDDQCNWSCSASDYHGAQYWTCTGGNLQRCGANGPEVTWCGGLGCKSNPAGIDDQCYQQSPGWSCAGSRGSDGKQYWTCSGDGNVHECAADGTPIELVCANGCAVNAPNTNDACKGSGGGATPTHARAAAGNGWALVRWTPAGAARSGFTVTASPGGAIVHVGPAATSATVTGLVAGTSYTFAVAQDGGAPAHTNAVVPGADANVIADVTHHPQTRSLTCEEASLVMALSHERIARTEDDVLVAMGIDWTPASWDTAGDLHWGDPYAHFVGSPDGDEAAQTGYGVYAPPIARVAGSFGANVLASGSSQPPQSIYAAVLASHPVVAWVTTDWSHRAPKATWYTDDGTAIGWYGPYEHAVTVVGVERDYVIVDNPLSSTEWQRVAKPTFETAFATFGDMAVVLY